jgi:hypothetical protein
VAGTRGGRRARAGDWADDDTEIHLRSVGRDVAESIRTLGAEACTVLQLKRMKGCPSVSQSTLA